MRHISNILDLQEIPQVQTVIQTLTKALSVNSVLCYGSYAIGLQDERSDIDLLIIVDSLPNHIQLETLYYSIPNTENCTFQDIAHWESVWTQLNASLKVDGCKFDIGFNTAEWVNVVVKNLIDKYEISFRELSFRPYSFLGLLENAKILYDKNQFISHIKSKIRPFPKGLKREIVKSFLPMLKDCVADLRDNVERNLGVIAYQFYLFMALDAVCQLLYVINDIYDPSSKRTEYYLFRLKNLPTGFMEFINQKLPKAYEDKNEFIESISLIASYIEKQADEILR